MRKSRWILAAVFAVSMTAQAYAGEWKQDESGIWYENEDKTWPTGWFQEGGDWYYAGGDGYLETGWLQYQGNWYYLGNRDGKMYADCVVNTRDGFYRFGSDGVGERITGDYTGWVRDDRYWHYWKPGGYIISGWQTVDGVRYYFEDGIMKTGPAVIDGSSYFFDDDGQITTGLATWEGELRYVKEDGSLAVSETMEIDGVTYLFDENGVGTIEETPSVYANWPYKMPVQIPPEEEKSEHHKAADRMAEQVLSGIVNDSMTQRQKAEAIYAWVRGNLRYSGHSATRDWGEEAYQGFRRRHGDCFTYFSVSVALLSKVGIDSIEVVRSTDNGHYWNLVNIDGQWYHFDATPRTAGGYFCLWTDAQMLSYSSRHYNCFAFDRALYPPTP